MLAAEFIGGEKRVSKKRRLIDYDEAKKSLEFLYIHLGKPPRNLFDGVAQTAVKRCIKQLGTVKTVNAVDAKQYERLIESYNDLRENFVDYACSGSSNLAPYCINKCAECVTDRGWCKESSEKCRGFNPAEFII